MDKPPRATIVAATLIVLIAGAVAILVIAIYNVTSNNQADIDVIQESRVEACQRTNQQVVAVRKAFEGVELALLAAAQALGISEQEAKSLTGLFQPAYDALQPVDCSQILQTE